jgi:hypothetical protein
MKKHVFVAGLLAGVIGLSSLAAGQTQLDISLEGPWILFTDTMTTNGKDQPVVVAIAPVNATAPDPIPNDPDSHFHHWPQMSSGNGYYLPSNGIFCLAFNPYPSVATGKWCALPPTNGATFNTGNGYTPVSILMLKGDIANKKWFSYGGSSIVVILPYPDFYHADGSWQMQFVDQNENVIVPYDKYTIGLVLHYSNATSRLGLYTCTPSVPTKITTDDCKNETPADNYGNKIEVTNSGTLRLEMRAPDTTDDCDHHVRFAYHQALKLIDPTYSNGNNGKYRYIDPAQAMNADDSGVFGTDDCWAADQAAGDQEDTSTGSQHPVQTKAENQAKQSSPFTGALNKIEANWEPLLCDPEVKGNEMFKTAHNNFEQAYKLKGSLRITDVQRMGALLSRSAQNIDNLLTELQIERSKKRTPQKQDDAISALVEIRKNEQAFANGTKNGADCRAAQVFLN